ncbi:cystinosin homolog [Limulus polyphemus]|uniref:Cystinosin homolog n=1 Tax=Limulus polyphemus TaxID=6850 RepID=A0ABM1SN86_LIMPO|nr:cystinosin homolog [Limulus polyphemus]XP_022245092.1 cystinosin homolog [Limulus polyphemus]
MIQHAHMEVQRLRTLPPNVGTVCIISVLTHVALPVQCFDISLLVSSQDLYIYIGECGHFLTYLTNSVDRPVKVVSTFEKKGVLLEVTGDGIINANSNDMLNFTVTSKRPGQTTIFLTTSDSNIDVSQAFVRIFVPRSQFLDSLSALFGWIYFIAWSASFYPQIYTNWKRQSVVGLSFDYVSLHFSGFAAYALYNVGLAFINEVQMEYREIHPTGLIPVKINDVVFALHATLAVSIIVFQCLVYDRGNQNLSKPFGAFFTVIWLTGFVFLILILSGLVKTRPWLSLLYYFAAVKLCTTVTKYTPQAIQNFRRKSTTGWSIWNVMFDFVGGVFSVIQMVLLAYNYNDWDSIFGNFSKFLLGVVSVFYDVLFMVQHYSYTGYQPLPSRTKLGLNVNNVSEETTRINPTFEAGVSTHFLLLHS